MQDRPRSSHDRPHHSDRSRLRAPRTTACAPASDAAALDLTGTERRDRRTPSGFTLSRFSAEELAAARHLYELPVPSATHLYLDALQHGLGSRSCGPDVTAEYQLWPRAFTMSVLLHVAG